MPSKSFSLPLFLGPFMTYLLSGVGTRQEPAEAPVASRNRPWVGENIEPDKGWWMARQIMYRGGNHPTPVNCKACVSDPRPRNCGGHATLPPCCGKYTSNRCILALDWSSLTDCL
jgi:hypothetical protein